MIDEPLYERGHRLGPRLVVQGPEQASGLPCRHERALGDVPKNVVVGEVGKRGHVGSKLVDESVERLDDEASFANGKTRHILVEPFVELVAVFALAWNASVASLARLVGEDHASESAVEELLLIELACGEGR